MPVTSREIRLVARPQGLPDEELFELVETEVPDPAEDRCSSGTRTCPSIPTCAAA
jgi:hypothetical protein